MDVRRVRRRFLGLLGMGASGPLLMGMMREAGAQQEETRKKGDRKKEDRKKGGSGYGTYRGTSKKGNLQEALDHAIKAAQESASGADRQVKWTLKEVTGLEGGIAPANDVTVAIEATII